MNDFDWGNFYADMNGSTVKMAVKLRGSALSMSATVTTTTSKTYHYSYNKALDQEYESLDVALSVNLGYLEISEATVTDITEEPKATVGKSDLSTGYLADSSAPLQLKRGGTAHFSFMQQRTLGDNWLGYLLWVGNVGADATWENGLIILRSDNWDDKQQPNWEGSYDLYGNNVGCWCDFIWATFGSDMNDATVDMTVTLGEDGKTLAVRSVITTQDGRVFHYNYDRMLADAHDAVDLRLSVSAAYLEIYSAWTDQQSVGTSDNNTPWLGAATTPVTVPNGGSVHYEFTQVTRDQAKNWFCWLLWAGETGKEVTGANGIIVLRNDNWEDQAESNAGCESNFNWDTWSADMVGSTVDMTVTLNGNTLMVKSTIKTADQSKTYFYNFTKQLATVYPSLDFALSVARASINVAKTELTLPKPTITKTYTGNGYLNNYEIVLGDKDIEHNPHVTLTVTYPTANGMVTEVVKNGTVIASDAEGTITITATAEGYKNSQATAENSGHNTLYTVENIDENGDAITSVEEGGPTGSVATNVYSKYMELDGKWYEYADAEYVRQLYANGSAYQIQFKSATKIVAFIEAENCTGSKGVNIVKEDVALSGGKTANIKAMNNRTTGTIVCTLQPGTYEVHAMVTGNAFRGVCLRNIANGDAAANPVVSFTEEGLQSTLFKVWQPITLAVTGINSGDVKTNQSADFDYLYIDRVDVDFVVNEQTEPMAKGSDDMPHEGYLNSTFALGNENYLAVTDDKPQAGQLWQDGYGNTSFRILGGGAFTMSCASPAQSIRRIIFFGTNLDMEASSGEWTTTPVASRGMRKAPAEVQRTWVGNADCVKFMAYGDVNITRMVIINEKPDAETDTYAEAEPLSEPLFENGLYYLQHVATGSYAAAGHDWGTRGVVNNVGLDFNIQRTAADTYSIDSRVSNGEGLNYLSEWCWTDGARFHWTIEKEGDDTYTLSTGTQWLSAGDDDNLFVGNEPVEWRIISAADRKEQLRQAPAEGTDATFLIPGANFSRNDERIAAWQLSDDCYNWNLQGGDVTNFCAESFHSTFILRQTLYDLPAGTYELTAQGFYRQDDGASEAAPYFFANDARTALPKMSGTENNMTDASVSFAAGRYVSKPMTVKVDEGGTLTIGVAQPAAYHQWIIFDNFRLTYYGNGTTGVSDAARLNTTVDHKVYDLQGRRVSGQPASGLYIINGRKVVVK